MVTLLLREMPSRLFVTNTGDGDNMIMFGTFATVLIVYVNGTTSDVTSQHTMVYRHVTHWFIAEKATPEIGILFGINVAGLRLSHCLFGLLTMITRHQYIGLRDATRAH